MPIADIGLWAAFILTLFVYSYLIGDNLLYRLAIYVFAGLTAGFAAVVIWQSAIAPWLLDLQTTDLSSAEGFAELLVDVLPLVFLLSLLLNPNLSIDRFPLLSRVIRLPLIVLRPVRRIALAFLIGVGAAVAMVGAITGTLIPLALTAGSSATRNGLYGIITLVGVVAVLTYFQYGARRKANGQVQQGLWVRVVGGLGSLVLAVTFGTIYAAAIATTLVVFTERLSFLLQQFSGLFGS